MRPAILLALAFLLLPVSASAQVAYNPFNLEPGDRVRFTGLLPGDNGRVHARVISVSPDFFGFTPSNQPNIVMNREYGTLNSIDVRYRSRRESARGGALWGAYLGVAAGLIGGPFLANDLDVGTGQAVGLVGGAGALVGSLAGSIAGALIAPGRWTRYVFQ